MKFYIPLMETRKTWLESVFTSYQETAIPLVANAGDTSSPSFRFADDLGLYWMLPWLGKTFDMSFSQAFLGLYITIVTLAFIISAWGLFRLCSHPWVRGLSILGVGASLYYFLFMVGDVYFFSAAFCFAMAPWVAISLQNDQWRSKFFITVPKIV